MSVEPKTVTARMYDVGFGDCMLLSFNYDPDPILGDRTRRHMLVDFGSTRYPYSGFKLERVTELLDEKTEGQLDVLVVTHRHKDHVSGFGIAKPSDAIDKLKPRMVIRPWPDHPDAGDDDKAPVGVRQADREFVRRLQGAHTFAAVAKAEFDRERADVPKALHRLADIGLANQEAIDNLDKWADRAQRRCYVTAGDAVDLDRLIPGASMNILGPPTLNQAPNLNSQRANDEDEYWFRRAAALADEISGKKAFNAALRGQAGLVASY